MCYQATKKLPKDPFKQLSTMHKQAVTEQKTHTTFLLFCSDDRYVLGYGSGRHHYASPTGSAGNWKLAGRSFCATLLHIFSSIKVKTAQKIPDLF